MDEGSGVKALEFGKKKVKQIMNFGHGISYIRTQHARTLVHNIAWNASILHQNSEQRCEKPVVIHPSRGNLVRSGEKILLHCNDTKAYIVYTMDETIPGFTNGTRYDPQRSPIIVPEDISFLTIRFVACRLKMLDSKICKRTFKITNEAPESLYPAANMGAQSAAIRPVVYEAPTDGIDLGLDTPSSSNMTPQHSSQRLSSYGGPYQRPQDDDDEELSDAGSDLL